MTALAPTLALDRLAEEAVSHLQTLLRFDTTNPPGNEIAAATYLREQLEAEGITTKIIEPLPGRASIWARLPGTGAQRPLMLVSHTDVVPVERERWTVDPFGGELRDGFIYGRGAVDMKQMTAIELTLMLDVARRVRAGESPPSRDLIFLAVADEERSGAHGMAWIAEHMPELLDAEYALNEGGGMAIDLGKQRIYLCEAAQKGSVHVTLRATGRPGHAAFPHQESAVVRLSQAISRLAATPLPIHVTKTARRFIRMVAHTQPQPQRAVFLQALNPLFSESVMNRMPDRDTANGLRAILHNTVSATILQAGSALNVIPGEAIANIDCRIIPGQTAESAAAEIRKRINDPNVAVEVDPHSPGYEFSSTTPLFAAISEAITRHEPGSIVAPYLFPAVSDSRFLAPRGVTSYGFVPHRPEPGIPSVQSLAHGHDERISVANVRFGTQILYDVLAAISK